MKRAIALTLSILMLLGTVFAVVLSLSGCKPMDEIVVIPTPTPEPTVEPTVDPLATPQPATPTPEPVYSSTSANGTPVQSHALYSFSDEEIQTYLQSVNTKAMPSFDLPDIAGEAGGNVKLADYRGKVVVVTAMASWCRWCEAQLPYLKSVAEQYSQDRVAFVGIDTFDGASGPQLLVEELREAGIGFRTGFDRTNEVGEFMSPRGSIPVTMVLDTEGVIRFYLEGAIQDETPLSRMIDFTLSHQGKMPAAS